MINASLGSPIGDLKQANGTASKTSDPGKFTVRVQSGNQTQSFPYWVVAVGTIPPGESMYPWSVVSTPFRTSLFILARNVTQFRTQYQEQVLQLVRRKGFTSSNNKPLETYHGFDCLYPPTANSTAVSTTYVRTGFLRA
jgi:lipocalin